MSTRRDNTAAEPAMTHDKTVKSIWVSRGTRGGAVRADAREDHQDGVATRQKQESRRRKRAGGPCVRRDGPSAKNRSRAYKLATLFYIVTTIQNYTAFVDLSRGMCPHWAQRGSSPALGHSSPVSTRRKGVWRWRRIKSCVSISDIQGRSTVDMIFAFQNHDACDYAHQVHIWFLFHWN